MNAARWRRIEDLFHRALERPAAEREQFLNRQCEGEETRREVETLLAEDDQATGFLDRPVWPSLVSRERPTHIGAYEVLDVLRDGATGRVFRAHDPRLNRLIVIRTVDPDLASEPEVRERFDREARAVSALTHPNICRVYDVGESAGVPWVATEFAEGDTLQAVLRNNPLAQNIAIAYAAQLASALAALHNAGVVHGDLKPAGIVLNRGSVQILDLPRCPAPAQDACREDPRTDIHALGCLLQRMLTGKAETHRAEAMHAQVRHVIERCVAADPVMRWQTARDLQFALEAIAAGNEDARPRSTQRWLPWGAAAAMLLLTIFAVLSHRPGAASSMGARASTAFRLQIAFPPGFVVREPPLFALSNDGATLLIGAATRDGIARWYLRRLDSLDLVPISGIVIPADASSPFWSFNGQRIAWFQDGKIVSAAVTGGGIRTVCSLEGGAVGGSWNQDGTILLGNGSGPLLSVGSQGGEPRVLTANERGDIGAYWWPAWLPDGKHLLYTRLSLREGNRGTFAAAPNKEPVRLKVPVTEAPVLSNGTTPELIYRQGKSLWSQRLRPDGSVLGEPQFIEEHVREFTAANGRVIYRPEKEYGSEGFVVLQRGAQN